MHSGCHVHDCCANLKKSGRKNNPRKKDGLADFSLTQKFAVDSPTPCLGKCQQSHSPYFTGSKGRHVIDRLRKSYKHKVYKEDWKIVGDLVAACPTDLGLAR